MPSGLIAPVGSEMLLKASICSGQGYLLANQRVDWSIARNGVGQFTELGFRDSGQLLSWWEAPHKIDDWSATSNTAIVPITLNTSTPDPNDDVPILRGEVVGHGHVRRRRHEHDHRVRAELLRIQPGVVHDLLDRCPMGFPATRDRRTGTCRTR